MPFWTYMLHCRGGYFYVGHTDDLERRVGQHVAGMVPGFTADHMPVELVWSAQFVTREEAKESELRIKGWSRAKKLALIRGDWERISALAKSKNGPSTSSGQSASRVSASSFSDCPELVEGLSFTLRAHPEAPATQDRTVSAKLRITDGLAWLSYDVVPAAGLAIPQHRSRERKDGLWQTTCFELFVRKPGSDGYAEFNFSPSGDWAAYRFSAYRDGIRTLAMPSAPSIQSLLQADVLQVTAALDARLLPRGSEFGLSAVIEEQDGTKSYWALAHPPGRPDFHHPACFAAILPPPERA